MPRGVNDYDTRQIQGRNSASANSVGIISPGLITDELTFLFDAGNFESCPAVATRWRDLVNGWRSTATNSPTYSLDGGGSIVYTAASSQYHTINQIPSATAFRLLPGNGVTIVAWVKRSGAISSYSGILFSRGTGSIVGLNCYAGNSSKLAYTFNNQASTYNWDTGLTLPDNAWAYAGLSVFSDRAIMTMGTSTGFSVATNSVTHTIAAPNDFRIGTDGAQAGRFFNGNIAIAGLYNRGLTQDELQQNFNATRARFGV
jgi:hypothetical protein